MRPSLLASPAALPSLAIVLVTAWLPACGGRLDVATDDGGVDTGTGDSGTTDTGGDVGPLCDPSACGPAPGAPLPCPDGTIPADVCARGVDGVCRWTTTGCPPPKPCGAFEGGACSAGHYCKFAGCPAPGATGTCAPKPSGCPKIYAPVCSCDGVTYDNDCFAALAGATVATTGVCGTVRSCLSNAECGKSEWCSMPDGLCSATAPGPTPPKPAGTCTKRPTGCPDKWDPVCGCNGVTFGNRCDAQSAGVNVSHVGACESPPPKTCGGFGGIACSPSEWCDYPTSTCGGADETGTCRARPEGCPLLWAPVCGCDGKTYANDCVAHSNGMDTMATGACK